MTIRVNNLFTEWKDIPEFLGFYAASNDGRILSLSRVIITVTGERKHYQERILLPLFSNKYGHQKVALYKNGKSVRRYIHLLVLSAFGIEKPFSLAKCRHLDGNPSHNALHNLKWGTSLENSIDACEHGTSFHVLSPEKVRLIREELLKSENRKQSEIANDYGVRQPMISRIKTRKRGMHV